MHIDVPYGRQLVALEINDPDWLPLRRHPVPPPLANPAAAVKEALDAPHEYPPLRRALTPDDGVVIVVDETLPSLAALLVPILEHICQALVPPEAITLLCAPPATAQRWLDDLPDRFQDIRVEIHNPHERRQLSYVATTRAGRRIYINRTAVDADQLVVLTRRRYDSVLGYAGGVSALYPALSDEATRQETQQHLTWEAPHQAPSSLTQAATEVAWLMGAPFFVQVIEGADTELAYVLAGPVGSCAQGRQLLDARWRVTVPEVADVVLASLSGDPALHTFADLARALACAARVVKEDGRIVLLTEAAPALGAVGELLRTTPPTEALALLKDAPPAERETALYWTRAVEHARIYLLSGLPGDTVEELGLVPLDHAAQAQRLLQPGLRCVWLPDAHKTMAVFAR